MGTIATHALRSRPYAARWLMLEALLRVQDFETFEVLLGALERTPLQARERRELLAEMYLRRGFAASAAEEWMAVCEQRARRPRAAGPGPRSGRARDGRARPSDFAAAALARDPDNEVAANLLAQAHAPAA